MRAARTFLSWILAVLVIGVLLFSADAKLFSDPTQPNVAFSILSERTGVGIMEPTGRYVVGLIELFAALLVLLPWTRRSGALLALGIAAGAVAAHLSPYLGQELPLILGAEETDGGELFYLSLALSAACGLLMFVHPGRKKRRRV